MSDQVIAANGRVDRNVMQWVEAGNLYGNQRFQWAYSRSPMYCRMDKAILDFAGWSFWDDLDGCLDAPECYPVGSLFGQGKYYLGFVYRGYDVDEHATKVALAKRLIDQVKAEMAEEDAVHNAGGNGPSGVDAKVRVD